MALTEQEFRSNIVREAMSWIGTPYRLNACVKGAGTDCARLLFGVMSAVGLLADERIETFSQDWFAHATEDAYLLRVLRHASKVAQSIAYPTLNAKPGCMVLLKTAGARIWNHGAIVTEYPRIVHAVHPRVEEAAVTRHPMWIGKEVIVLDPWKGSSEV